jgi:hypothetical protein
MKILFAIGYNVDFDAAPRGLHNQELVYGEEVKSYKDSAEAIRA